MMLSQLYFLGVYFYVCTCTVLSSLVVTCMQLSTEWEQEVLHTIRRQFAAVDLTCIVSLLSQACGLAFQDFTILLI